MKKQLVKYVIFYVMLFLSASSVAKASENDEFIINKSKELYSIKLHLIENGYADYFKEYDILVLSAKQRLTKNKSGETVLAIEGRGDHYFSSPYNQIVLNSKGELIAFQSRIKGIKDLNFFSQFSKLKILSQAYLGVDWEVKDERKQDITIKGFPALEDLFLFKMGLNSIDLQLDGNNLRYLSLYRNPLTKSTGLGTLTNLEYLDLTKNQLSKIEGIENLHKLKYLGIDFSEVSELPSFKNFPELEILDAKGCNIAELIDFGTLTKLTSAELHGVPGISKVTRLPRNLKTLYFVGDLDRIPPDMANLQSLELLVLAGSNISKIEHISGLKKLKDLTISRSKLTQISGLTDLPSLEYLRLSANPITKIEGLDNLTNLNKLVLSETRIRKIENLNNLVNLEWLVLDNTPITKIENIKKLQNLKVLEMIDSAINEYDLFETEGVKASIALWNTPYSDRIEKEDPDLFRMLRKRDQI